MKTMQFPSNPGTLLFLSVELPKAADPTTTLGMGLKKCLHDNVPLKEIINELHAISKVNPKMVLNAFGKDIFEKLLNFEN